MGVAERNGAVLKWGAASVSVRVHCPLASPATHASSTTGEARKTQPKVSVAWLVLPVEKRQRGPFGRLWDVSFGAFLGVESDPKLKDLLSRWAGQFSTDGFAQRSTDHFAKNAEGSAWSIAWDDAARHGDLLAERLRRILVDLKSPRYCPAP